MRTGLLVAGLLATVLGINAWAADAPTGNQAACQGGMCQDKPCMTDGNCQGAGAGKDNAGNGGMGMGMGQCGGMGMGMGMGGGMGQCGGMGMGMRGMGMGGGMGMRGMMGGMSQ